MNFRAMLEMELEKRRQRNPRYSLRAFARYLGTDHSTLSQLLRNRRNLSPRMVRRFGSRLRLDAATVADACLQVEADAVLRLARSKSFCTHSRWIATRTNISLDAVNVALQRLLQQGRLRMSSANFWHAAKSSYA